MRRSVFTADSFELCFVSIVGILVDVKGNEKRVSALPLVARGSLNLLIVLGGCDAYV